MPSNLDESTTKSPSSTSEQEKQSPPAGQAGSRSPRRVTLLDLEATDEEIEAALKALQD